MTDTDNKLNVTRGLAVAVLLVGRAAAVTANSISAVTIPPLELGGTVGLCPR